MPMPSGRPDNVIKAIKEGLNGRKVGQRRLLIRNRITSI